MSEFVWRRSTQSGPNGDACVEVATNVAGVVAVRDSKDPRGPVLAVSPVQWRAFLSTLRQA
jgi:hypothetical protein